MNKYALIALVTLVPCCGKPRIERENENKTINVYPKEEPTATQVVPCPEVDGPFKEVFLCINEKLYAVYDSGNSGQVHLTELTPGPYRTTDGRQCTFNVIEGCKIDRDGTENDNLLSGDNVTIGQ